METAELPDDMDVCHGMIRELSASSREAQRRIEQLEHRLDLLLRRLFGPKSERFDPDQMLLFADGVEEETGTVAQQDPAPEEIQPQPRRRPIQGHGRRPLPADLPRERVVHELTPEQRVCPGNRLFAGSDGGGRTGAILFSVTTTCKGLGIDPFADLRDVRDRVATHPSRRLEELLPDRWRSNPLVTTG